jgi:hypothetical protein
MLSFRVFAKLQPRLHPLPALLQPAPFSSPFIQPLCFQTVTHSFAQRTAHICFPFNHFRTLSIVTGGVPLAVASRISSLTIRCCFSPFSFHTLTNCKFSISFLLTIMQIAGGVGGPAAAFLKHYFNFHDGTPYQPSTCFAVRRESGQSAALTLDCPIDFSEEKACEQ